MAVNRWQMFMPNIAIFAPNSSPLQLLIFLIAYPLLMTVSILPYPLLYALSDGLSFTSPRGKIPFKNRAFKSRIELSRVECSRTKSDRKRDLSTPLRCVLRNGKNLTISEKEIKKRFVFKNMELINAHEKEQSTICFLVIF